MCAAVRMSVCRQGGVCAAKVEAYIISKGLILPRVLVVGEFNFLRSTGERVR